MEKHHILKNNYRLQAAVDGWIQCANDFTSRVHIDPWTRLSYLEVIEFHIKERYATADDDTSLRLREYLLLWVQEPFINGAAAENDIVKNKMAELYAITCVIDYPSRWDTFFKDLLKRISSGNPVAIDLYLRILLAIDVKLVNHSDIESQYWQENQRNILIKESMRRECVASLVKSWYQIMEGKFIQCDFKVICLVMKVVGAYISWIDIDYVTNEQFLGLLLKYLEVELLRKSSCECFIEMVRKDLDEFDKVKLVELLTTELEKKTLHDRNFLNWEDKDIEFKAKLSKLINEIGIALIFCYYQLLTNNEHLATVVSQIVLKNMKYMTRCLADNNEDVSKAVIPFAIGYIEMLMTVNMSEEEYEMMKTLLVITVVKKYDGILAEIVNLLEQVYDDDELVLQAQLLHQGQAA